MKTFAIDFIRQAIIQTIQKNYIDSKETLIGNENQIMLSSFYEHLASNEEIDRFVNTVRDLNDQQNRMGLIANGVVVSPSSSALTNVYKHTIIPFEFSVNFRTTLENRDLILETLDEMVKELKGRKRDMICFNNGKPFMVGTSGNKIGDYQGNPYPLVRCGDFLGFLPSYDSDINTFVSAYLSDKTSSSGNHPAFAIEHALDNDLEKYYYVARPIQYQSGKYKLIVVVSKYFETPTAGWRWVEAINDGTHPTVIFPPEHDYFDLNNLWKLSISFETNRCSEPRTLNSTDVCDVIFGGSATLCDRYVSLGNDLLQCLFVRSGVKTKNGYVDAYDSSSHYLEPLEQPSGNAISSITNQLASNKFLTNNHNDSLTPTLQYTFILDKADTLLNDLFKFARYGTIGTFVDVTVGTSTETKVNGVTPNMEFYCMEIYGSFAEYEYNLYKFKLNGNVDIENTESDVMTLTISAQVQGEND